MNNRKIKKVLITDGAGFIGSAVVRQFIKETVMWRYCLITTMVHAFMGEAWHWCAQRTLQIKRFNLFGFNSPQLAAIIGG